VSGLVYSLRMLRRDWRAGELRVLVIALVVAVASVSAVGFFTDRVQQALHRQANELLGADLVVESDRPLPAAFGERAAQSGLQTAAVARFRSMVLAGGRSHLGEVKAVTAGYPLRGELRVARTLYGADASTRAIPAPGTAWADADLMRELDLRVGDTVTLGSLQLVIRRVLTYEPDRSPAYSPSRPG
jgi:putative ABC transport system permease protein